MNGACRVSGVTPQPSERVDPVSVAPWAFPRRAFRLRFLWWLFRLSRRSLGALRRSWFAGSGRGERVRESGVRVERALLL